MLSPSVYNRFSRQPIIAFLPVFKVLINRRMIDTAPMGRCVYTWMLVQPSLSVATLPWAGLSYKPFGHRPTANSSSFQPAHVTHRYPPCCASLSAIEACEHTWGCKICGLKARRVGRRPMPVRAYNIAQGKGAQRPTPWVDGRPHVCALKGQCIDKQAYDCKQKLLGRHFSTRAKSSCFFSRLARATCTVMASPKE
jgi:hypothetical protein